MIKKLLIANRGEIACRIIKTAKRLGIKTVAVCSEVDLNSSHVIAADEFVNLGGSTSAESYLDIKKIINAIKTSNADAVHPGYGFLSENVNFSSEVTKAGKIFVGPPDKAISVMGDKIASKKLAFNSGVSVVPGGLEILKNKDEALKEAKRIKFPVIIKASAGGGGKGMRVVYDESNFQENYNSAISEAKSSFGDSRVFVEKFVEEPRHIEIQVFGDKFGNIIHLGERECSIQRRHQKVIEEAPSKFVDENLRKKMAKQSIKLAKAVNYYSAGTVEFVVDKNKQFYFLEMNTRLQVEHPVTELITKIDLVELMIKAAAGEKLSIKQDDVKFSGWAIESRIYAEDSARKFLPSIGRLTRYIEPKSKSIRVDSGVVEGSEISMYYDPMISKLCVFSNTRSDAIINMINALDRYLVNGVQTNKHFLSNIFQHKDFKSGNFTTKFIEENYINGFDSRKSKIINFDEMMAVATFVHFKYMMRASSISNQVKGFTRRIGSKWNVIVNDKTVITEINYNNYNQNFDIFVNKKYIKFKSDWKIGFPLLSALIDNNVLYFEINREGPRYSISHKSSIIDVNVLSDRHAELNAIMVPRKKPDTSKFLLSPMPGLLSSIFVKKGQKVQEGESLVIIEAMKMENIIKAEKDVIIKEIFCKEKDSLLVDQSIIEFE
tara:strand:- start:1340 stop:3328 length:1989 start_codon:yes stop_codon:yes gene_type:complete